MFTGADASSSPKLQFSMLSTANEIDHMLIVFNGLKTKFTQYYSRNSSFYCIFPHEIIVDRMVEGRVVVNLGARPG